MLQTHPKEDKKLKIRHLNLVAPPLRQKEVRSYFRPKITRMFIHHLRTSFRVLTKNKFYAGISIAGLSIAMGSALFMMLYLQEEWSYDRFNEKPEEIYRVVFDKYLDLGKYATTPLPVGPALAKDFPEISAMTRVSSGLKTLVKFEEERFFERVSFLDPKWSDIFKIPVVHGEAAKSMAAPNQAVISQRLAKKYFGDQNPLGKTLAIGRDGSLNSVIAAVIEDFPDNSHIQFDLALSFATFEKVYGVPNLWQQMPSNYTYIRLAEATDPAQLAAKLPTFSEQYVGNDLEDVNQEYKIALQPLLDIYLHSDYGREMGQGNLRTLYLLATIALLVLLIASINYINYAIARFAKRVREVSIRKVIGATRKHLIYQLIGETLLTVFLAGIAAVLLANTLLPAFNVISGKNFGAADLQSPWFLLALALLIPFLGLAAGLFPALYLSGFRPVEALKGRLAKQSVAHLSRKGLIVFQFTTAIVLIGATFTVWRQMSFIRDTIRPESQEQVAILQINKTLADKFPSLKQELQKIAGVQQVSAGSNIPTFYGDSWPVMLNQNSPTIQMENYTIQDDYLETMGYELLAGRPLNSQLRSDVDEGILLTETAMNSLGFLEPEEALGQEILWGGSTKKQARIRGIVKDFNFGSFHEKIEPAILQFAPYEWMISQFLAIRFTPEALDQIRPTIQTQIAKIDPSWHTDLQFLDEGFMRLHEKDRQLGKIFAAFSLLAIFISCIGLFGLVAFSASQRTKEIGIRKVLGASVQSIVELLSKDFMRLVFLAILLGLPLAWYSMHLWLESFAYRIELPWQIFLLSGGLVFLIAGMTVGWQGFRAAILNPVQSLRSE